MREIEKDQKVQYAKEVRAYGFSENYSELCSYLEEQAEGFGELAMQEQAKSCHMRDPGLTSVKWSEQDKNMWVVSFLETCISKVDDTEGGKLFKEYLEDHKKAAESNILYLVGHDMPTYSEADRYRYLLNFHATFAMGRSEATEEEAAKFGDKLDALLAMLILSKDEESDDENPYATNQLDTVEV